MRLLKEIDILHNKMTIILLNILVLPLFFLFLMFFVHFASSSKGLVLGVSEFFYSLLLSVLLLVIHEGIHGIFFKQFCPQNPVKFGMNWKSLMAYATSPGSLYSRKQMVIISLAPFVVITLILSIFFMLGWLPVGRYVFVVSLHAAGCIGDFYYGYLLLWRFRKEAILVEDTEIGLKIYLDEGAN